ncbi:hypothetical protein [Melghirimyces profundicolus]|uniref:hypothetical protein n=1 Tax=Melghirimyces profundicolus TaxID=1242148 RepID=UPI0011B2463D|nr:hypothetical protein [Melghirimyces profundicolus]
MKELPVPFLRLKGSVPGMVEGKGRLDSPSPALVENRRREAETEPDAPAAVESDPEDGEPPERSTE